MINLVKRGFLTVAFLVLTVTFSQLPGQDVKTDKAEANFCEGITNFLDSLKELEDANLRMDIENFTDAYKKVDKAWNKLVKSAKKLEKIDTKEATIAYDNLAETLEEVVNRNIKSSENTNNITKQVDACRKAIKPVSSSVCD